MRLKNCWKLPLVKLPAAALVLWTGLSAQMAPTLRPDRGRCGIPLVARRPRQEVCEPVPLEEVAEAVPNRDLRDLRQAADLAGARARGHVGSVPRRGPESV